jgi:hypothetical protein
VTINPMKQITIVLISLGIILSFTASWTYTGAQRTEMNLIGNQTKWQPAGAAHISQNNSDLEILVVTNKTDKTWNRAYLPMRILSNASSIHFTVEYASKSNLGNATFVSQVRDNSSKVLWSGYLENNTGNQLFNRTFTLPNSILNRPVEFRFNVITNGTGDHVLDIKKATMSFN